MSYDGVAKYVRWFEYERDSHAGVLASLRGVPESLRGTEAFEKAVGLMAHIVAARLIWLYRFGVARECPADFFPRGLTLDGLAAGLDAMHAAWSSYLLGLTDEALARAFDYQSYEGPRYRNTVEDILTQLFGHSLYHRGQIALLLRQVGAEPAETDFVFWTREPITEG